MADAVREEFVPAGQVTAVAPVTPALRRIVYNSVLFSDRDLVHESSMRNHPLTPMTDSSIPRLLQALSGQDTQYAVVDTLSDRHLAVLGAALLDHPLVTGGSGLVGGLAVARGFQAQPESANAARPAGPAAVAAGSCSEMTNVQIDTFRQFRPDSRSELSPSQKDATSSPKRCCSHGKTLRTARS